MDNSRMDTHFGSYQAMARSKEFFQIFLHFTYAISFAKCHRKIVLIDEFAVTLTTIEIHAIYLALQNVMTFSL